MDAFIKGFLGLFIAAMITYIAVGTISAELDASSARGFMDSAKKEIAESNFSGNVIQEVGRTAKENGYALEVNVYGKKHTYSKGERKLMQSIIKQIGGVMIEIALYLPLIGIFSILLRYLSS